MKRMLMAIAAMMSWCVLADTWVDMSTRIEWTYWVSPDNEIELQGISHYLEDGSIASDQSASFGDLKIPATIKGLPVKSISGFMFVDKNVDSVWMPDSIVKIGDGAFKQNGSITNIHLSASLASIGNEAFLDCSQAAGLYLPSTVTELGIRVFEGCQKVADITVPAGLTEVPEGSFSACYGLTNVVFHEGITTIGDRAFSGCTALKEIDLPSTVTSIGREAFSMCAMKSMVIPDGVQAIGDSTFTSCMSLETISIPDSVTNIGESAFMSCEKLNEVNLSDNVTSIGRYAFSYCKALKSFRIPSKVTTLTDRMLGNCESLEAVEIPQNVTSFSSESNPICYPFWYCKKLTRIELPSEMSGACGFQGCESLVEIVIPDGITDFDFNGCTKLQYLTIPTSVTTIPSSRFSGCNSLKMITFNGNAPSATSESFFGAIVGCVSVPEGSSGWDDDGDGKWFGITIVYRKLDGGPYKETVDGVEWTYMVSGGFAIIGRDMSTQAISENVSGDLVIPSQLGGCRVVEIAPYAFGHRKGILTVIVPEGVYDIGYASFCDCANVNQIVLPESLTNISAYAFYNCKKLSACDIPDKVAVIGYLAFAGCEEMGTGVVENNGWIIIANSPIPSTIVVDSTIKGIVGGAFHNCTDRPKTIIISEGVEEVGVQAFVNCRGVESVTLPSTLRFIGGSAFASCSSLKTISIPDGVTKISSYAFSHCCGLESVKLSNTTTDIDYWAFYDCKKVIDITLPSSVTNIGSGAFSQCSSLSTVRFNGDAPSVGLDCFKNVSNSCVALVDKNSTGWNVEIPGVWQGINIDYYTKPDGGPYKETVDGIEWSFRVSGGVAVIDSGEQCKAAIDKSLQSSIVIPSTLGGRNVTVVGPYAFYECSRLTSVTIPESVTNIAMSAFSFCSDLESVILPSSVQDIGHSAFSGCSSLSSITIPSSVKDIGNSAFAACYGLTTVMIESGVTTVGDYAFSHCHGLTSITIPSTVTSIGVSAFESCVSLDSVSLSEGLLNILQGAFENCGSITSVTIPSSVTHIANVAFLSCSKLTSVCFNGNAPYVVETTFSSCAAGCTAYVKKGSTGWGVDIPGTWNGINIAYYTVYEVEGAGEVKIHDDWVQKYAPGKSEEEVTELLAQPAANGKYKNWECYVLGLDPTNAESKIVVSAPQSQDSSKIDIGFNLNVPAGSGYKVNYSYVKNGEEVACGDSGVSIDLTGSDDPSGLYTIKVKLVPDGSSTSTSEIEVEQTVGVRKSTSELTKTAIAVPWGELTGKGAQSICVSNIVKTANLTAGDKLHVYNITSRAYETWQLSSNLTWEPLATYVILEDGSVSKVSAGAPTTTMIARGSAVWLERQDTSKPFYLYGEYQSGTIETSIVSGTTETPVWNFVAPPTLEGFDLNNITGASEDDKIVVTTANGPKIYTYKQGAWGSDVNTTEKRTLPGGGTIDVVKKTRDTSNTTIAAGTGFMYVSQGGAPTIQW